MNNKFNAEGTIIKASKLWWIKINTKSFRTSPLDGATFPYLIKVKYNINNIDYIKNKLVYWGNENIQTGDKVIITYDENKPSKILKLSKTNKYS